jgi:succinate-acetate transporter protein
VVVIVSPNIFVAGAMRMSTPTLLVFAGIAQFIGGLVDVGGSALVGHIGGWFLIVSAGFAFYAGGAISINSSFKRTLLPLFSRA